MSHADTGIIESEWVNTGPDFARSHPIARRLGAVWLVVIWVAAQLVAVLVGLVDTCRVLLAGGGVIYGLLALLLVVVLPNKLLALFGLLTRNTVAWYPVWLSLVLGAMFTFPLIFSCASGRRPNSIYRHRFERLVRPAGAGLA